MRRAIRRFISVWLVIHIAAIIIAPAAMPPASPLFQSAWMTARPYLETFYLNHGYHFFAPEPSFSTLVSYHADLPDGTQLEERMPNRGIWPRLLYHRHFMLTEFLTFHSNEVQLQLCESYQAHLRHKHRVEEVTMTKVEHLLPSQFHILDGGSLQHEELWVSIPLSELREQVTEQEADVSEGENSPAEETTDAQTVATTTSPNP
jgi:hypothetical protein